MDGLILTHIFFFLYFVLIHLGNFAVVSIALLFPFFFNISGNLGSLTSLIFSINKFWSLSFSSLWCYLLHICDIDKVLSLTYSRSARLAPWHLISLYVCLSSVSVLLLLCVLYVRLKRVSFRVSHIEMKKKKDIFIHVDLHCSCFVHSGAEM